MRRVLSRQVRLVLVVLALLGGIIALLQLPGRPGTTPVPPSIRTVSHRSCQHDPAPVPPPPAGVNYLHTCGNEIYDARGHPIRIVGVSWFGLETPAMAPDGLWVRNWQTILDQLAALGFNTLRLPFSDDIFQPGARPSGINYLLNPDLTGLTSLEVMDRIIAGARQRGLRVLLDRHRPTSAGQSDLWYTRQRSEADWIAEWQFLARRYRGNDAVIGADLENEPRGPATWGTGDPATDWRLAAQRAGNAILAINPYWLIFVEGIEHIGNDWYWWGGNLAGVARAPVVLNLPNRVVYSPHDYGPDVYPQGWFRDPTFPRNLPGVWDAHWGYIAAQDRAPVVLGEFGGRSVGSDAEGQWHRTLVAYLTDHQIGFISWALNPDSADTGGILQDDWLTVNTGKTQLYTTGALPPRPGSSGPAVQSGPAIELTSHRAGSPLPGPNASFIITLLNHSGREIPLGRVTIRYWVAQPAPSLAAAVDWAQIGASSVTIRVVPDQRGSQQAYLEIGFHDQSLPPYGTTGPILIRYHRTDWKPIDPTSDYSFPPGPADTPAERLALYQSGRLITGRPP
jgi:endoglucanase